MVRTLSIIVVSLLLFTAAGLFLAYRATQSVPEFYQLAMNADSEIQKQKSAEMFNKATALIEKSRQTGKWTEVFTAEQINGFLAVDLEKQFTGILPDEIKNPRVAITENEITLACQYTSDSIETILTLSLEVYISEPNVLAVRIRRAKAGSLPLPLSEVLANLAESADYLEIPIQWREIDGDPVAVMGISAIYDEKREELIQLESVQLKEGEIHLIGRTIDPMDNVPATRTSKIKRNQAASRIKFHR